MNRNRINKKRNKYGIMKISIKVQAEIKKYKNKIQFINLNSSFYNLTNYKAIYLFRTNSQVIKTC